MNEPIKTYSDKLKDPRWQKLRLSILERDKWSCVYCGNASKELQIHHLKYMQDTDPWEYDFNYLVTACCDCHADETSLKSEDSHLFGLIMMAGIKRRELYSLTSELTRFVRRTGTSPHLQFQRLMEFLYANG